MFKNYKLQSINILISLFCYFEQDEIQNHNRELFQKAAIQGFMILLWCHVAGSESFQWTLQRLQQLPRSNPKDQATTVNGSNIQMQKPNSEWYTDAKGFPCTPQ